MGFSNEIFNIKNEAEFERLALRTFQHQYESCTIYRNFCDSLKQNTPKNIYQIPFLPISFFKSHAIHDDDKNPTLLFRSSGTGGERSTHYVIEEEIYETSFTIHFEHVFGACNDTVILALLPNYVEQGESSLIYMVNKLIELSASELSGFILNDPIELNGRIQKGIQSNKKIILFGVTYALLDLNPEFVDLSQVNIIETGGMKGRRKELSKEEFHAKLKNTHHPLQLSSEFGMTELFSQAYAQNGIDFISPAWMKVLIRDINDPLSYLKTSKTGGINVIDLANYHSCSFIATQDLGKITGESFQIQGRFDHSDIRGCNLLVQ